MLLSIAPAAPSVWIAPQTFLSRELQLTLAFLGTPAPPAPPQPLPGPSQGCKAIFLKNMVLHGQHQYQWEPEKMQVFLPRPWPPA